MNIDFGKGNGLVPVIIQDDTTMQVLMLGYMNEAAFAKTQKERRVTFYSRSKQRLWTKGEKSGHFLEVKKILIDCDNDSILIRAYPVGPTCHKGNTSCFDEDISKGFLYKLEQIIHGKIAKNAQDSYSNSLFNKGINKVAQKVGEEAIETIIEAKGDNIELFKNEVADLLYHLILLLRSKKITIEDIEQVLQQRNVKKSFTTR